MNQHGVRVLCVEEEQEERVSMATQLGVHYTCTTVDSTSAALAACAADDFAVVVTAQTLRGMTGMELLRRLRMQVPDAVGVLMLRDTEFGTVIGAMHDGGVYRYVQKPCPPGALLRAVREAADYHALVQSERRLREQLTRVNAELENKVRELDEASELLEYWVEFSPAVLYSLSNDGGTLRTSYISKNFARLTGFERTEAVVDPAFWRRLVLPAHVAAYDRALALLGVGDGNHAVLEYAIRHRDGATVTLVDAMRAVRDGDGLTVEIVGAWLDVSGRT